MRTSYRKAQFIPVYRGDIVKVDFSLVVAGDQVIGEVLKVRKRFALLDHGTREQTPIITVRDADGNERRCDASLVVEVIQRAKLNAFLPSNIFRDIAEDPFYFQTWNRGIICGSLKALAEGFLAQLPFKLECEIDYDKLLSLFEKQRSGFIRKEGFLLYVRKKPFKNWVRANAFKICRTIASERARATAREGKIHDDYFDNLKSEMREDWWNDFFPEYQGSIPY